MNRLIPAFFLTILLAGCDTKPTAPRPEPKPKTEPRLEVKIHHRDLGRFREITLLVSSDLAMAPEAIELVDDEGNVYNGEKANPAELFLEEFQNDPGALAVAFSPPGTASSLDVRLPDGRTRPVYRRELESVLSPSAAFQRDGWKLKASGTPVQDSGYELTLQATPERPAPPPLHPKDFILITDGRDLLTPKTVSEKPLRLRYGPLPASVKTLRLQTFLRGRELRYLEFSLKSVEPSKPDTPPAPPPDAPPDTPPVAKTLPPSSLRSGFEARRSDPVKALKFLAEHAGDDARELGRPFLAETIEKDLAQGLKDFAEGRHAEADRRLTRAALLSSPFSPSLSLQLVRALMTSKHPRRTATPCSTCSNSGSTPCTACKSGLVSGPCPRCHAGGRISCLLCNGDGQVDHYGYTGTLVLILPRSIRVRTAQGMGTLPAQTVTYRMSSCSSGTFSLTTYYKAAASGQTSQQSLQQSCTRFWNEMKMFVFNGRAMIKVPDDKNQLVTYRPSSAKRLFADYERCRDGLVPCERCRAQKDETCPRCDGAKTALVPCPSCGSSTRLVCTSCKGYGDASWLSKLFRAAPSLSLTLSRHAADLKNWVDARAGHASWNRNLAERLTEMKKGLDPNAKFRPGAVEIACTRCSGKGGDCEACWRTGRVEHVEGTCQYERYALVQRLEQRIAKAAESTGPPPPFGFFSVPRADLPTGRVRIGPVVKNPGGPVPLPKAVEKMIKEADAFYASGCGHLTQAKRTRDNTTWIQESRLALDDLRKAQTLYTSAQETLDMQGLPSPQTLVMKYRTNLQALVIARKQAP